MKLIVVLTILSLVSACQIKPKTKKDDLKDIVDTKRQKEVPKEKTVFTTEFWPEYYYRDTFAIVKLPKFKLNQDQLWKICKGPVFDQVMRYSGVDSTKIQYLVTPVEFYTDSGFKMEVFLTRGMCRELALHSSHGKDAVKLDKLRRLRYFLKEMKISFVYTKRTLAKELIFDSKYKGVEFIVR